jgi:hypothetical protein
VREVCVEDVIAQPNLVGATQSPQEAVVRELIGEGEGAGLDLTFDDFEAFACAAKIGFRGRPFDRGAIANAINAEVELDSARGAATTPPVNHLLPIGLTLLIRMTE